MTVQELGGDSALRDFLETQQTGGTRRTGGGQANRWRLVGLVWILF